MSSRTVLLAVLAAVGGLSCRGQDAPLPSTDKPLAVLARPLLDGSGDFDVSQLEGKVVLVNFWSPG